MIELRFDYVDLKIQKEPWYKLEVINQWDWSTKPICFRNAGKEMISYCLKLNIPKDETSYISKVVDEIPELIKKELIKNGYTLSVLVKPRIPNHW